MSLKQIQQLGAAAKRANTDAGFKFIRLCEPALILEIIGALRKTHVDTKQLQVLSNMESLCAAASGKRLISDEGIAFTEACTPELIAAWCDAVLACHQEPSSMGAL